VQAHLSREIELIAPQAIIALGAAAWHACSILAEGLGGTLDGGSITVARLQHHGLQSENGTIPLHATFLPGRINEGLARERSSATREDVGVFLRCIGGEGSCEVADRQYRSLRQEARPQRAAIDDEAGFREWKKRLKAVGLWPHPQEMTFEGIMR